MLTYLTDARAYLLQHVFHDYVSSPRNIDRDNRKSAAILEGCSVGRGLHSKPLLAFIHPHRTSLPRRLCQCRLPLSHQVKFTDILAPQGTDDTCRHILNQIVPAMEKGYSKILVKDLMVPDRGADWLLTTLDVEIMQSLGGKERMESELRSLLESVGLKVEAIFKHPRAHDSIIEAVLA